MLLSPHSGISLQFQDHLGEVLDEFDMSVIDNGAVREVRLDVIGASDAYLNGDARGAKSLFSAVKSRERARVQ
jgi:hypothetical protein